MRKRSGVGLIAALLAFGAFLVYRATLCPDLYWFDSAEFVNDAVLLDVPHPPGYPLYNLLAHAFTWLPFGTLAARVNLLSAVASACAVGAIFYASVTAGAPRCISAASAALFAVSDQFWDVSVAAEVYGLEVLLIALALCWIAKLEADEQPIPASRAWPLAVFLGLALFHRPTVVFFVAGATLLLWRRLERPFLFAATMLVGALPYLHTAWVFAFRERVAPGFDKWSMNYFDFPRTFETFVRVCTGTLYAGNLAPLSPGELVHEVVAYLVLAREQLTAVVVGVGFLGGLRAFAPGTPRFARYLAVLFVANLGFFLFYNALEKDTMYVPSFLALTLLAVQATREVWERPRLRRTMSATVALVAVWVAFSNAPRLDRHRYHEVRRAVDATAKVLPPRAWFYLTDDLIIHPFLHVMTLEGVRRDVRVTIVDGFGDAVRQGIADHLKAGEPVLSTLFYPEDQFKQVRQAFTLVPRGFLYELFAGPARPLPAQSGGVHARGILGTAVFPPDRRLRRSDQLQVVISWDMTGATDPAAVFSWQPPQAPEPLVWVHRIGYQGRPRRGNELTEEYLLKVPWNLTRAAAGAADLQVSVIPSIAASSLRVGNTRDWNERVFFKANAAGFVKAIERGWPVYAEFLSLGEKPGPGTSLGAVELVKEVE